jgi:hypothetical protein
MEMEGGGGSEMHGVGGSEVHRISGISTEKFGVVRVSSRSRAASLKGVNSAGPLWSVNWKVMWFLN